MANITQREKTIKQLFIGNCWKYLHDNFAKFSETNKIKIALELCKKDTPQEMNGSMFVNQLPPVTIDGEPLHLDIGSPIDGAETTTDSTKTDTTPNKD